MLGIYIPGIGNKPHVGDIYIYLAGRKETLWLGMLATFGQQFMGWVNFQGHSMGWGPLVMGNRPHARNPNQTGFNQTPRKHALL